MSGIDRAADTSEWNICLLISRRTPMAERRDGRLAIPYPFMLRTRWGRWLPTCPKHRLVFNTRVLYEAHWSPLCNGDVLPPSDHLRHVKGYRRVRR